MRPEVLYPLLFSIPVGLAVFIIQVIGFDAHLRGWKDKVLFFLWPNPPRRMLIVRELDNSTQIYYNDDFEEIQGEEKTVIRTIAGDQYVTEIPPSKAMVPVAMFDARGPEGSPSPMGLAWRWAVGAATFVFMLYTALVFAWSPPMIRVGDYYIPAERDMTELMVTVTVFFSSLTWLITNIMRMGDRTIMYAWYHAKGLNPPYTSVVPIPTLSNVGMLEYLSKLGRQIVINIPKDSVKVINNILNNMEKKLGNRNIAAIILSKLSMCVNWRLALMRTLREIFALKKTAENEAMIRMKGEADSIRRNWFYLLVAFIFGLLVGYVVFGGYGFSVAPAGNTTNTTGSGVQNVTPQLPQYPGQQTVPSTPQQPTVTATGPPGHTGNVTVTPAQPPPPPGVTPG